MAKKIKFPLEMKDGKQVRTMEELRQHFDAEKLLMYYINGKLLSWLSDRHYDKYLSEIEKIEKANSNVLTELCRVLEIERVNPDNKINFEEIERKNNKIMQVKQYTDRSEILENIDLVAMNQKEFEFLIKAQQRQIYLFGKEFVCPISMENVTIEGINNPVVVIDSAEVIDFEARKLVFRTVTFDAAYQALVEKQNYEMEHRNDKKNKPYQPSSLFDIRLSDDDRKECSKLYALLQKELAGVTFDVDVHTKNLKKLLSDADLQDGLTIDRIGKRQRDCLQNAHLDDAFYDFCSRIVI